MVKSKKRRNIFALSVVAICLCCAGLVSAFSQKAKAETYAFQQTGAMPDNLTRGEKFSVPNGKFGDVPAERYVYCPNGDVYTSDEITLETYGEYVIKYVATIEGKVYVEEKTVQVSNPASYFTGTGTGSYTKYEYREDTKRTGLTVRIADGDTFVYNKPVDLSQSSYENPAVSFTWLPENIGMDASLMYLRFTDAYDADNWVEIRMNLGKAKNGYHWPISQARSDGQLWKAWDSNGILRINSQYGCGFSSYGADSFLDSSGTLQHENVLSTQKVWYWYDTFENKLYQCYIDLNRPTYVHAASGSNLPGLQVLLIDFDDASYQESIFPGFTTGEVFVSVRCEEYTSDTLGIQLLSAAGQDISVDTAQDLQAQIAIDTGDYTLETLPNGNAGYSYPVFGATASDIYCGILPVETRVFYNYTKSAGVHQDALGRYAEEMPVKNGRFATPYEGDYSISYRTKNYVGEYTEYVVTVHVDAASMVVPVDDIVLESGYKTSASEYEQVPLANVASYGGGKGVLCVSRFVSYDGQMVELKGNDVLGYSFMPKEQGAYTVTYRVLDLVNNTNEISYTVTVENRTAPAFLTDAQLPKLFFSGEEYTLPVLQAYDVTKDKNVASEIKVIDGSGERAYTAGNAIAFTPDTNGNAVVRYTAGATTAEYVVPVVLGRDASKNVQIANYFKADDSVNFSMETNGAVATTATGGSFEYLNAVLARDLTLEFNVKGLGTKFNKFVVTLTDAYDELCTVKLNVVKAGNGLNIVANGGEATRQYKQTIPSAVKIVLRYDADSNGFYIDSELFLGFSKTSYAEVFNGFASNRAYVSFAMEEVVEEATVSLLKINNQSISSSIKRDNSTPLLYLMNGYTKTTCDLNQIIAVDGGYAGDVLSPYTDLTVSVTFGGKPVVSQEGVTLKDAPVSTEEQYTFKVEEFGEYILTYTARDWNNKTFQRAYRFTSRDSLAPELTLDGEMPAGIALGYVTLPAATATDNVSKEKNIRVFAVVFDPVGNVLYVNDNQFVAQYTGEYTVCYYAVDEAGNESKLVYRYTIK